MGKKNECDVLFAFVIPFFCFTSIFMSPPILMLHKPPLSILRTSKRLPYGQAANVRLLLDVHQLPEHRIKVLSAEGKTKIERQKMTGRSAKSDRRGEENKQSPQSLRLRSRSNRLV